MDFPHYGDPLAEIGHIWGFWALSGELVKYMWRGGRRHISDALRRVLSSLFCCLFIIVTTQFVALYKPCKPKPKPSTYDPPDNHPLAEIQIPILRIRVEVNCNYYVHPNLTDIELFA